MMEITMTIQIPALDRLCAILEGYDKSQVVQQVEDEIVRKLKEAAEGGVPRPTFEEVPADEEHPWKDEAKPESAPEAKPAAVTLADVQRACAALRDAGRKDDVRALFPEFGIRKISDLKDDQMAAFAARLEKLGGAT